MNMKQTQPWIVVLLLLAVTSIGGAYTFTENWDYTPGALIEEEPNSLWRPRYGTTPPGDIRVKEDPNIAWNYIVAAHDSVYVLTPGELDPNFNDPNIVLGAMAGPFIQVDTKVYNVGGGGGDPATHVYLGLGEYFPGEVNTGGAFTMRSVRFSFEFTGTSGITTNVVDFNAEEYGDGLWWDIRMVIEPDANGGNGAAWLFYKEPQETDWRASGVLAGINLALSGNPDVDEPATEWNSLLIRLTSNAGFEGRMGPITIQSVNELQSISVATNPNPPSQASAVPLPLNTMAWLPGTGAVLHDVFLGTSLTTMEFKMRTGTASYSPEPLEPATTYFWRIDEYDGGGNLLAVGSLWQFTTAQPFPTLAYEGWDYASSATGVALAGVGTGGFGWDVRWQGNGFMYAEIRTGSLEPAFFYPAGTSGQRLHYDNSGLVDGSWRRLAVPVDLSVDEDYYVSFLVMGAETFSATDYIIGDFQLRTNNLETIGFGTGLLRDGQNAGVFPTPAGPALTEPKFYLMGADGTYHYDLDTGEGNWVANTVYLVVLKVSAVAVGNDTVSMSYFDPGMPPPGEEPGSWTFSHSMASDELLTSVWIENRKSDNSDQVAWDEIRVGLTWGSVTGWASVCGDLGTSFDWYLDGNCHVDLGDFSALSGEWNSCTTPGGVGCKKHFPGISELPTADPNGSPPAQPIYEKSSPITVDGNLDDWADAQWFSINKPVFQSEYTWDVSRARYAVMWDSTNPNTLCVAAKVRDVDQRFSAGVGPWTAGDQMEFKIEANGTGSDTAVEPDYTIGQIYRVGYNGAGGSWAAWGDSSTVNPASNPASGLVSAARLDPADSNVICYELSIQIYDNFGGFDLSATTLKNLVADGVIRFGVQVDSRSELAGVVDSGAISDIAYNGSAPETWPEYVLKASSTLACGDWGILLEDIDENCDVGLTDLAIIAFRWLSCTDPQDPTCSKPWLP